MDENLKWEKKEKLNFTKLIDQVGDITKMVAKRELDAINGQILALQRMGCIKDPKQVNKLQNEVNYIRRRYTQLANYTNRILRILRSRR